MSASTNHVCFRQPPSENIRLWRYMDFTKFVSLISSSKLFFCRSDLFSDPFEGSYSKVNVQLRPQLFQDMEIFHDVEISNLQNLMIQRSNFTKKIREWTYINCWHANEYESAAMWDLYAKTNEGVAVETDYLSLKNVLPDNTHLGLVNYIDYETEWLPEGNTFYPFTHKRKSFEHEKEVRAVMQELPSPEKGNIHDMKNEIPGINIKIELNSLIKNIHVSPTAPKWLVDLTREITVKYGIAADVKKSDLYSEPVY
jgi:hypothetical protein